MPENLIHLVEILAEPAVTAAGEPDSIGGWPLLGDGAQWPVCFCGRRMVFFFQVGIPAGVAFFGGDHLLAFQCPEHDDAPFGPARLPERYWDEVVEPYAGMFWRFLLRPAGAPAADPDPYLTPRRLALRPGAETVEHGRGRPGLKVGGVPSWAQGPERHRCSCGTDMMLLCQVPENFGFDMWPMLAAGGEQVQLFLGNEMYLLACPARCHPEALWPVLQN